MSQEIEEITAEEIVKPMAGTHPEVRPNAVMAHQKSSAPVESAPSASQAQPATAEVFKDKTGEIFNAEKHYGDEFGRPQLTAGGYFRKIPIKKRLKRQAMKVLGRSEEQPKAPTASEPPEAETPKASEPAPEQASEPQTDTAPNPEHKSFIPDDKPQSAGPDAPADEFRAAAKALCSTIFTVGVSVGGVQCKPLPQHVESMERSWEQYFRQRGKIDVPPGVAVALSTGGYAIFCYQSSQLVQQQVGGLRGWIIRKIGGWKTNRAARRASKSGGGE